MKKIKELLRSNMIKKLKSNQGMTMVELLCATMILLLVSAGMVSGIQLAQRQYFKSMRDSDAQVLFSTIESILTNELRYTTQVHYSEETNLVETFYSVTYAVKNHETALVALDGEGNLAEFGELALGYDNEFNRILGTASYPRGLGASAKVYYNKDDKIFTVFLTISLNDSPYLENRSFQVRALNNIILNQELPN